MPSGVTRVRKEKRIGRAAVGTVVFVHFSAPLIMDESHSHASCSVTRDLNTRLA